MASIAVRGRGSVLASQEYDTLVDKPKILLISDPGEDVGPVLTGMADSHETVMVQNPVRALALLTREKFAGVYVTAKFFREVFEIGKLLQNEQILEGMPDGVVLLEGDNTILWGNGRIRQWSGRESVLGVNFFTALGSPEILGPDFCPFHTALATGQSTSSMLRSQDNRYFQVHAAPMRELNGPPRHLIVTVRDVTHEVHQQQKIAAIHQAGMELADLTPEELFHMPVKDRIELLKANIAHFTKDLLNFEVVEVRLLDQKTNRLEPLLALGMTTEAANRVLYALPQHNGVTGFVAATGKSYLCEDTAEDPLYLEGVQGAKSSLTVPLSVARRSDRHLQRRERRAPGVQRERPAIPGNLQPRRGRRAEYPGTPGGRKGHHGGRERRGHPQRRGPAGGRNPQRGGQRHGALHRPRAGSRGAAAAHPPQRPRHQAGDPEGRAEDGPGPGPSAGGAGGRAAGVAGPPRAGGRCRRERPQRRPRPAGPLRLHRRDRPRRRRGRLHGPRLLDSAYDVVIADIRLPDMNGYELMLKLQEVMDPVPLVLMTGFGYDPGHSIVNARKAGLPAYAVLYKPFRLDQLLSAVERIIEAPGPVPQASGN